MGPGISFSKRLIAVIMVIIILVPLLGSAFFGRDVPEEVPEVIEESVVPDWVPIPFDGNPYTVHPRLRVDDGENVHVVYLGGFIAFNNVTGNDSDIDEGNSTWDQLYYARFGPDGNLTHGPIQVNTEEEGPWAPAIALDSKGQMHIAYGSEREGKPSEVAYVRIGVDGEVDVGPIIISTDDTRSIRPNIEVDSNNNAHIVYTESLGGTPKSPFTYEIRYSKVDASGKLVVENKHWSSYYLEVDSLVDIAIDSRDIIHVVYITQTVQWINMEIHYHRFDNNGNPLGVDRRLTHIYSVGYVPKVAIGPDDSVHIAWYDDALDPEFGKGIWYMVLGPTGMVRKTPSDVSNGSHAGYIFDSFTLDIMVDSDNTAYIQWFQGANIWYNTFTVDDYDKKDGIFLSKGLQGESTLDSKDRLWHIETDLFVYRNVTWPMFTFRNVWLQNGGCT